MSASVHTALVDEWRTLHREQAERSEAHEKVQARMAKLKRESEEAWRMLSSTSIRIEKVKAAMVALEIDPSRIVVAPAGGER